VVHLIHRLQEIDERLGGDGAASPIEDAVAVALQACQ
jgi:hypothetical protein